MIKEQQEPLPVDFDPGENQDVTVALDEKAEQKRKIREREAKKLADRAAYEKLGLRVLKLKVNTYRILKKQIAELGIKTIGHCGIIIAREKAEAVIAELDGIAKEWELNGTVVDPEVEVSLQRLKLDCIKIMVESGAEHLRAERQPSERPPSGTIQLPFEAGMPIAVAIGRKLPQIEGSVPSG